MAEQIDWYEGLFLYPHHLQAQQRQLDEMFAAERIWRLEDRYGVVEMELKPQALGNSLVEFARLRVVTHSGLVVDVPGNADLNALPIREAVAASAGRGSFTVYLAIPRFELGRANARPWNAADAGPNVHRYIPAEREVVDENTGEGRQTLRFRRINAMLMLEGQAQGRADLEEMIPLLKVACGAGPGAKPQVDPSYVPPCVLIGGSEALRSMIAELDHEVQAIRRNLARQMAASGFTTAAAQGARLEQLLRLAALNRFAVRLPPLWRQQSVTPRRAYLELREFLAELAALHPERDPFDAPDFNHDDPLPAFSALVGKIRPLLDPDAVDVFTVPFTRLDSILVADLRPEHFALPPEYEYYLGVRSERPVAEVIALVENREDFRLLPRKQGKLRLLGVTLEYSKTPPVGVPIAPDLHYFRLRTNENRDKWEQARSEGGLAVWINPQRGANMVLNLTLHMTIPAGGLQR